MPCALSVHSGGRAIACTYAMMEWCAGYFCCGVTSDHVYPAEECGHSGIGRCAMMRLGLSFGFHLRPVARR